MKNPQDLPTLVGRVGVLLAKLPDSAEAREMRWRWAAITRWLQVTESSPSPVPPSPGDQVGAEIEAELAALHAPAPAVSAVVAAYERQPLHVRRSLTLERWIAAEIENLRITT